MRKPTASLRKILANNIIRFRNSKNLSQESLAELCGLHRTYIGSIERSERNVTLSSLETIAFALETNVPNLLQEESPND
jgi:transcriptional regulator with XRE-family HTH domain